MSTNKSFVHLHNHADGSTLDGLAQISKLVPAAGELGMPSIAITDHGSQSGTYALYNAAKDSKNTEHPVKPIYGIEAYLAPDVSRTHKEPVRWNEGGDDDVSGAGAYTHMTMWAENNQGLHNLFKMSTESYETGFYRKPRFDEDLLNEYHEGILATTGCPSGEVQTWLRIGNYDKAIAAAAKFADIFGKENFFVELMDHGLDIEKQVIPNLMRIAKDLGLRTVATNDLHYIHSTDAHTHDALLCIGSGSKLADEKRFRFSGQDFYLKTAEEMRRLWDDVSPEACDTTLLIAERCDATLVPQSDLMPQFPVPEGETEETWLRRQVEEGLVQRYTEAGITPEIRERAEYELGIINRMEFPGYFLVVSDYIKWAKEHDIRVGPGRGCLTADTNVLTPLGFKKINQIKTGDIVFDETGKQVAVTETFEYDCDEELVKIEAFFGNNGNVMTKDHKVLISKANRTSDNFYKNYGTRYTKEISEPIWVRADEVEIGDLVVMPKLELKPETQGFDFDPVSVSHTNVTSDTSVRKIAKRLGISRGAVMSYFKKEGAISGSASKLLHNYFQENQLSLETLRQDRTKVQTLPHSHIAADFNSGFVFGLFISDGWIRSRKDAVIGFAQRRSEDEGQIPTAFKKVFGAELHSSDHKKTDLRQYTIYHKGLAKLFRNLFAEYKYTADSKYIPDALMNTPEDFRQGLLEGLWYGDGTHKGKSKYTTVSERLAENVYTLLLSLELPAKIRQEVRTETREAFNKAKREHYTAYSVTTSHNFDNKTIIQGKGFDGKFNYYRVRNIELVPSPGKVYDFTVPTTHSYVTDSYVVHNSGAGSLVAYATKITELDPIRHKLMFERFLNPERVSMPDFDIDFDDRRRGEVIDYVTEKYGADKVVQITTFNTVKAKAAIKDSARVLGAPYMVGDKLSKVYPPPILGRDLSLAEAYDPGNPRYDEAAEFRNMVENDPEAGEVVTLARGLEGVKRGHGMHAAGVIMSREPITNIVPLMKRDTNSPLMTQFEYKTCEYLGLIKMDFLGLSNLGTLDEALRQIKKNRGIDLDLDALSQSLDDQKTYDLLAAGDTIGVFQLDSPPIRSLLKLMSVNSFDDISAVIALYRPGPMGVGAHIEYAERKTGRRPIVPIHRELEKPLEDVLGETFGLVVYQEQVMSIAQKLADFSLGKADELRRAMGKKNAAILAKEFGPFSEGMLKKGYSMESIQTLWDVLVPFADYAFNRAHSASYGLISYWTAYLKANFPAEYMSALLTTNSSNKDKLALYLGECRRMGIQVLSPDVNDSDTNYSAVGDDIRVGLIGIKGIGEAGINLWIQDRELNGKAKGFGDYLMRAPTTMASKRSVEALIVGGAFDSFGFPRAALDYIVEDATARASKAKKAKPAAASVVSLFDEAMEGMVALEIDVPADIPEWTQQVKLAKEREVLGLYVSGHPLAGYEEAIDMLSTHSIAYLRDTETPPGDQVKIAGLVVNVERKVTKANAEPWAIVTVEDFDSGMSVMVFPRTYAEYSDMLVRDEILSFSGRVDKKDDGSTTFAVKTVTKPDLNAAKRKVERQKAEALANPDAAPKPIIKGAPDNLVEPGKQDDGSTAPIRVRVEERQLTEYTTTRFKAVLEEYPGSRPVHLLMKRDDGTEVELELGAGLKVVGSGQLAAEIRALFGGDSVV